MPNRQILAMYYSIEKGIYFRLLLRNWNLCEQDCIFIYIFKICIFKRKVDVKVGVVMAGECPLFSLLNPFQRLRRPELQNKNHVDLKF